MQSKHARLDRFISKETGVNRRTVKRLLAEQRVVIDGAIANNVQQRIGEFSHVVLDGEVLQAKQARYIMLNKPQGVVSATKDPKHVTVLDLLEDINTEDLHIAGRLDFNSTGLLLLTNDGQWSRRLSLPQSNVSKRYRVKLKYPIGEETVEAFSRGMYFAFENMTTRPATLKLLSPCIAEVCLKEGRYHQIKRMFGRFQNPVLELHRLAVGNLILDSNLALGESRYLCNYEIKL